jgi:hypothetical protein
MLNSVPGGSAILNDDSIKRTASSVTMQSNPSSVSNGNFADTFGSATLQNILSTPSKDHRVIVRPPTVESIARSEETETMVSFC